MEQVGIWINKQKHSHKSSATTNRYEEFLGIAQSRMRLKVARYWQGDFTLQEWEGFNLEDITKDWRR